MKKKLLVVSFMCICSALAAQIKAPQLSLSLEECLALAETESLSMLMSELLKQELDDDVLRDWLNYIPKINFEQSTALDNSKLIIDGVATDERGRFRTSSSITFHQRLFDQQLVDLIKGEKNLQLKKQIIELSSKSSIFFLIREAYCRALIYEQKLKNLEILRQKITDTRTEGTAFLSRLLDYKIQEFLIKVNMQMLTEKYKLQDQKRLILRILNKSFESELVLTSPLIQVKLLTDDDKKNALQNNIFLKRYMLDKIQHERHLSILKLSFLPNIKVSILHKINNDLALNMDATLGNSVSNPFSVNLDGSINMMQKNYDYDFDAHTWEPDISHSASDYPTETSVRLTIQFPLQKISDTKLQNKIINRQIKELELQVQAKLIDILQNLQIYSSRITRNNELISITEQKVSVKQAILELLSAELVLEKLSDLEYYLENLDTVLALIDSSCTQQLAKYEAWNDLQTEIESGTRFVYDNL